MYTRNLAAAALLALLTAPLCELACLGNAALAQELPPPRRRPGSQPPPGATPTPGPAPRGEVRSDSPAAGRDEGPGELLVICDLDCALAIDGVPGKSYAANKPTTLELDPGEHLLVFTNEASGCAFETIAEANPRAKKALKVELAPTCSTSFDAVMAQLWMAQQDFTLAGRYVEGLSSKDFRSSTPADTGSLYATHQTLKSQFAKLAALAPADPARQRIAEEMARISASADKYVELLTEAIGEAKADDKGIIAKIFRRKDESSRALQATLEWSFDTWNVLRASPSFAAALPAGHRIALGLASGGGPPFDLGVDYYNFQPNLVVFVRAGGLADRAGMKGGDRLLTADGRSIGSVSDLQQLAISGVRRTVLVRVDRRGKQETLQLAVPGGSGAGT
jgi:hypothetical protein